jgi:hypothetical protein
MTQPESNLAGESPSAARLLKSTLVALVAAFVILLVAVLPAEYGVDPTGVGRVLGLTQMGEIKVSLAREAAAEDVAEAASAAPAGATAGTAATATPMDSAWKHVTIVTLAPGAGKEVKLVMKKGARATFEWVSVGGPVNHDTHGDSTGAPNSYISYRKATGVTSDSGALTAAMDGAHGWFWRNRGATPVSVTLRTRGDYSEIKKMWEQ